MKLFDGILPLLKLGAMATGAALLWHLLPARGRRRPADPARVTRLCRQVVMAVEQAHGDLPGADKKQLAEAMIGDLLSHLGMRAPKTLIDVGVESAVLRMKAAHHGNGQNAHAVTVTYTYDRIGNLVGNTAPPPAAGPRSGGTPAC